MGIVVVAGSVRTVSRVVCVCGSGGFVAGVRSPQPRCLGSVGSSQLIQARKVCEVLQHVFVS